MTPAAPTTEKAENAPIKRYTKATVLQATDILDTSYTQEGQGWTWVKKLVDASPEQLQAVPENAMLCMTPVGEPYAPLGEATSKEIQADVTHCVALFVEHGAQLFKTFLRGRFESRKKRTVREMTGSSLSEELKDSFDFTWEAMRDWNLFMKYEKVVMDYIQQRCLENGLEHHELAVYKLETVERTVAMSKNIQNEN
jgi:hypothetical protein